MTDREWPTKRTDDHFNAVFSWHLIRFCTNHVQNCEVRRHHGGVPFSIDGGVTSGAEPRGRMVHMTQSPHTMRCARRIAREVKKAGGSDHDAASVTHRHCGVSMLRAHRAARGFTLVEAVEALQEVLSARGVSADGLSHQRLSRWEQGHDVPSPHYMDALCFLYRSRPDRLGFGSDYSEPGSFPPNEPEDAMNRRNFVGFAAAGAALLPVHPVTELIGVDFDPPGGSHARLGYVERLEESVERSSAGVQSMSPAEFIPARMMDLARVQAGLLSATGAAVRRRLQRVYARNAGLIAIRLSDVGAVAESFEWFAIARRAARAAEDEAVQGWVAGWTGDACAFHQQFKPGLAAAQAAQSVGAGRPSPEAVLGCLAEAGIAARLGDRRATFSAVARADRMFALLPAVELHRGGFGVSEYLLRWNQANALALVGAHAEAAPLRERVLALPQAGRDLIGRGLLCLDEAAAEVDRGELESACHTITTTWLALPPEFQVGQIPERVREVLAPLPATRSVRPVAEVRELIESSVSAG
ncbi:helix-turn-helix domain-containing protein [Nocardia sp. NPDC057227]|uniref:helix-turn-helix domain-containing protein n=1 Tax=Nocardia sp. NPDC057227 TaxID=3346056 RepID=UPI00363650E6